MFCNNDHCIDKMHFHQSCALIIEVLFVVLQLLDVF